MSHLCLEAPIPTYRTFSSNCHFIFRHFYISHSRDISHFAIWHSSTPLLKYMILHVITYFRVISSRLHSYSLTFHTTTAVSYTLPSLFSLFASVFIVAYCSSASFTHSNFCNFHVMLPIYFVFSWALLFVCLFFRFIFAAFQWFCQLIPCFFRFFGSVAQFSTAFTTVYSPPSHSFIAHFLPFFLILWFLS